MHVQVEVFQNFDVSTPTRAQGFRAERSNSETYERVYRFRNVENAVDVRIPQSFSCKATPITAKSQLQLLWCFGFELPLRLPLALIYIVLGGLPLKE